MTTSSQSERPARQSEPPATEQVVAHVRRLIEAASSVRASACPPSVSSRSEMVSALFYEQRRLTTARTRGLARPAQQHRSICQAIRAHDRERAQAAMNEHLRHAQQTQASERHSTLNSQL